MPHPSISDRTADRLFALVRLLHREMKLHMSTALSPTQLHALFYIRCCERPLMREIAQDLSIKPQTATTLIEDLESLGFVRRVADPKDKRAVRIQLTPRGRAFLAKRFQILTTRIEELLAPIPARERLQFATTLDKILTSAEHPLV